MPWGEILADTADAIPLLAWTALYLLGGGIVLGLLALLIWGRR